MSNHDPINETPASASQGGRAQRKRAYITVAVVSAAVIGAFASSPLGQGLGHRMLANVPGMAAAAAPFEGGFGPGFAADWQGGLFSGAIEAVIEAHADRMIRHMSIEIDATTEQQDKLRSIVSGAVKDLLPVREKVLAARTTARELLAQQTIDRTPSKSCAPTRSRSTTRRASDLFRLWLTLQKCSRPSSGASSAPCCRRAEAIGVEVLGATAHGGTGEASGADGRTYTVTKMIL
jgi:Spy/CpxP family protein refolding chaperone